MMSEYIHDNGIMYGRIVFGGGTIFPGGGNGDGDDFLLGGGVRTKALYLS